MVNVRQATRNLPVFGCPDTGFDCCMSPSFFAAWFPDDNALLLAASETRSPALVSELHTIRPPAPGAASLTGRRYWTLPGKGVVQTTADGPASYEIYRTGDSVGTQLELDAGLLHSSGQLFIMHLRDCRSKAQEVSLGFVWNEQPWTDVSELHASVRQTLRLKPHYCVEKIWHSPILANDKTLRLGPVHLVWPYGWPRILEIHSPKPATGLSTKVTLTTRYDTYDSEKAGESETCGLSPVDDGVVIVLAWRSLFSARSKAPVSSSFLEAFHENLRRYLGRSIPLTRNQTKPGAVRRPITRGVLLARPDVKAKKLKLGQVFNWEFSGPLDLDDVLAVFVASLPGRPVNVILDRSHSPELDSFTIAELQVKAACWRAELDGLVPVAWADIEENIRASLEGEVSDQLRHRQHPVAPATTVAKSASNREENRAAPRGRGDSIAEALAAAPQASPLQCGSLFTVEEGLREAAEEWFATLTPDIVQRLYTTRTAKCLAITNIARFLPIDPSAMLAEPGLWVTAERDAAALYERITEIHRNSDSKPAAPSGNLRRWTSRALRQLSEPGRDDLNAKKIAGAFASDDSDVLPLLDPGILREASSILGNFAETLKQISREVKNESSVQSPADSS